MVNTRNRKDDAADEATSPPTDNKSSSTDTVDVDHQESNEDGKDDAAAEPTAPTDNKSSSTDAVDVDHQESNEGGRTVAATATEANADTTNTKTAAVDAATTASSLRATTSGDGDDNGNGSASNDRTKGNGTAGTAIGVLFNPPTKSPSPDPESPDQGSRYTASSGKEGNDAGDGDDNRSESTLSSDDLPGSTVNCDSVDSVSYLASPAKQSELTNVFDEHLVYSSVVMDPSMTGCTIPRDGKSGVLFTIGTNHNPLKHTTSAELQDRMLGKPTNATIETHLHGNIVNDAFQSFVFCGPKECLKQDAPKRSILSVNYTMMTRLGPNYGQESESNIGIDLYKHVQFTEHIKKTTEMLETSNLRTKDWRMKVAQHYNISDAWGEKEKEFSDKESEICEIINAFNSMRWEQGYDFLHDEVQYNVYFDIMEGRHRWVASICTNESSRYDQDCPKIEYGSLNDEYIKESLIQNNASKPFATNMWKEVIKNSKFNAKEEACKQVQNGTYGMKSQIKFSVHTIHLKSAPEDEKVRKKEGSQEKLIYYLNDISAQSRLSKGHVSKPSTLEALEVTLEELNIEMKRRKVSRRMFSADPNRIKIGTTPQELFKAIIVGQTPVNSALMKLKKNYTIGKEEETISSYHKMSPDGLLDETQEIKHYIEQPNTNTFTLLQDRFTSFVETNQGNADELFKDYSESIRKEKFDQNFYYRNKYIETGKEPRFKGNEKINSSKHTLKPPFPLTYYNLLQNKKKPKNREQPVLLSLSTMNHLLVIPLIHKCCRETNYHSANLKPDQLTKQLRYIVKYHTSLIQANNALEMNPIAQIIYGFDKGTMVKEIDSVTACTLTLSHAVNAELMNNVDVTSLINKIAKSKLNQNIGKALSDTQVQYSIGIIGIMSNVLGNMLSNLIVQGIKNASKTSVSGIFPQLLRTLICSQAIYDGMDVFGNVGCNPTLNTEVVKVYFPQFLTVWNAFYSGTTVDNTEINRANDILSAICPVGNDYRDVNPMLCNGQEVATHLTTKTALKSNKYLIAWVTFIIYYHERVTASEDVIHDEPILKGGRVGYQITQKKVVSTIRDNERFEGSVMEGFKSNGDFDGIRFEWGARPKNLRQFALSSKTNWLNLLEWMALLFEPINDNCSEEFKRARESALAKLHNESEPIKLDLITKYASKVKKPKPAPTTKAKKPNPNPKKQSPNPQSQTSNNNNNQAQTPNNSNDGTVSSITTTTKSANAVLAQDFDKEDEEEYEEEPANGKQEEQQPTSDKPTDERKEGNNSEKGAPVSTGNNNSNKSDEADPVSTGRISNNMQEQASNGCNINDNKKRDADQLSPRENEGESSTPKKKKQATNAGSDNNTVNEVVRNDTLGGSNNKRDGAQGETDIGSNKRRKVDDSNKYHLDIAKESTRYRVRYQPYMNKTNIIHNKFIHIISPDDDEEYIFLTNEKYNNISTSDEIKKHKEELLEEYSIEQGEEPTFGVASFTITNETDISFYNDCLKNRKVTQRDYWKLIGGVYKGKRGMLPQPSPAWERHKSSLVINYYRKNFAVLVDIMKTRGYRYISEKIEGDDAAETKCLRFLYITDHPIKDLMDVDESDEGSFDPKIWSGAESDDDGHQSGSESGSSSEDDSDRDSKKSGSEKGSSSDDDSDYGDKKKGEEKDEQEDSVIDSDYNEGEDEDDNEGEDEDDNEGMDEEQGGQEDQVSSPNVIETEEAHEHDEQEVNGADNPGVSGEDNADKEED